MAFYAEELILGLIGLVAAASPLILPRWKSLYRFVCIVGALAIASLLSAYLAQHFFDTDPALSFIRAFIMIALLQNIAIRIPAYPTLVPKG